jgi:hypothetical protein
MTESESRARKRAKPKCLDIAAWRLPTKQELLAFLEKPRTRGKKSHSRNRLSTLAVRHYLSPVDVYCYLKGRFGEPNGFQNFLRKEDSDNWIHWDFNLRAGDEDVYICGMSREIHFLTSAKMTDENWRDLILGIKADYRRVGKEKSAVLKSLEQWVIFPNRYIAIANVCADLHADIVDNVGGFLTYKTPGSKTTLRAEGAVLKKLNERATLVHKSSLQLSLLTPVLAEAFINMIVLMLCKPEIRSNKRQFDAFIRSQIDTRVFDLAFKCEGFVRPIDQNAVAFKDFKRVMDKRNHAIHGNCDPEREQIEMVYFEGTRPLFRESGDHIGKFLEALERQYQPQAVIQDYEDTHKFLDYLVGCLEPGLVQGFARIIEDPYPGYDIGRNKVGALFPEHVMVGRPQGIRYDDELTVWS